MNREQFITHIREMLPEFQDDHEACTGIDSSERHSFEFWLGELQSLFENTREARP